LGHEGDGEVIDFTVIKLCECCLKLGVSLSESFFGESHYTEMLNQLLAKSII